MIAVAGSVVMADAVGSTSGFRLSPWLYALTPVVEWAWWGLSWLLFRLFSLLLFPLTWYAARLRKVTSLSPSVSSRLCLLLTCHHPLFPAPAQKYSHHLTLRYDRSDRKLQAELQMKEGLADYFLDVAMYKSDELGDQVWCGEAKRLPHTQGGSWEGRC